ncbi:hypothetical protein [Methylobacterium sp. ID0610]|uniref:hypothetical protein n=1 Tax=Methylobacterium carpenticola TaxID=3344827 RepID=UPI0036B316A8
MIGALFALSLLMILGGLAAIAQGLPFVRLEIGWTMVIAGAVGASGGAVLLGIAVAVARLARIEHLLAARAQAGRAAAPEPAPPLPAMPLPLRAEAPPAPAPALSAEPVPPADEPPPAPPVPSPVAAALGEAGVASAAVLAAPELRFTRADPDDHPSSPAETEPAPSSELPSPPPDAAAAVPAAPPPEEPRAEIPAPEMPPAPAPEPPSGPEPEAGPGPEEPAIVGTYASGGNTYVMYSDGTIDAQTPGGKYRFHSLDELKTFIAEGGEAGDELRSGAA